MRKKELLAQNMQLFDRLTAAELQIAELKKAIAARDAKIAEQKNETDRLNARLNATEPLKALEAKVVRQAAVSPEVEYGASVIGKTVLEATKCCNTLTAEDSSGLAKELINLILGRTEVAKAEILKIVTLPGDCDGKKERIDEQYKNAAEYFESVMAQRDCSNDDSMPK